MSGGLYEGGKAFGRRVMGVTFMIPICPVISNLMSEYSDAMAGEF